MANPENETTDSTPEFVYAAKTREIKNGQIKEVQAGKDTVAITNVDGTFYAFSPWCPHQRWPLWSGDMQGELVRCFLHRWQFNVRTGKNVAPGGIPVRLPIYPVEVREDEIWVNVEKLPPREKDN